MKEQATIQEKTSPASLSVLVLVREWPLSKRYQQQLLTLAQFEVVNELILPCKQLQELPPPLKNEPKLRVFQLSSDSLSLMAEAGAFEANAHALLILKEEVAFSKELLQEIPLAISKGFEFGGIIAESNSWRSELLKLATFYCKGLCWFCFCKGYFMSRRLYHQSGGFKDYGRSISFFELLCKQRKISPYTFIPHFFKQKQTKIDL